MPTKKTKKPKAPKLVSDELIDQSDPHIVHRNTLGERKTIIQNRGTKSHGASLVIVANQIVQDSGIESPEFKLGSSYLFASSVNDHQIAHNQRDVRAAIEGGQKFLDLILSPYIVLVCQEYDLPASVCQGASKGPHDTLVPLLPENAYPMIGKPLNNGARLIL